MESSLGIPWCESQHGELTGPHNAVACLVDARRGWALECNDPSRGGWAALPASRQLQTMTLLTCHWCMVIDVRCIAVSTSDRAKHESRRRGPGRESMSERLRELINKSRILRWTSYTTVSFHVSVLARTSLGWLCRSVRRPELVEPLTSCFRCVNWPGRVLSGLTAESCQSARW